MDSIYLLSQYLFVGFAGDVLRRSLQSALFTHKHKHTQPKKKKKLESLIYIVCLIVSAMLPSLPT